MQANSRLQAMQANGRLQHWNSRSLQQGLVREHFRGFKGFKGLKAGATVNGIGMSRRLSMHMGTMRANP